MVPQVNRQFWKNTQIELSPRGISSLEALKHDWDCIRTHGSESLHGRDIIGGKNFFEPSVCRLPLINWFGLPENPRGQARDKQQNGYCNDPSFFHFSKRSEMRWIFSARPVWELISTKAPCNLMLPVATAKRWGC